MTYTRAVLIAVDQLLNAVLGGWPDETLSSCAYRMHRTGKPFGFFCPLINALFFWQDNHCEKSFHSERLRQQSPPEERENTPKG